MNRKRMAMVMVMGCLALIFLFCTASLAAEAEPQVGQTVGSVKFSKPISGEDAKYLGLEKPAEFTNEGLMESRREGKTVICNLTDAIVFSNTGWELDLGCCRLQKPQDAPLIPVSRPPLEPDWLVSCFRNTFTKSLHFFEY